MRRVQFTTKLILSQGEKSYFESVMFFKTIIICLETRYFFLRLELTQIPSFLNGVVQEGVRDRESTS